MQRTIIISEIGINHNGDIEIAKQLIKGAKDAGADIVKFQKRDINSTYSQEELDKPRESPFGNTNRLLKEGLEFNELEYDEIDRYCKEIGIDWCVSCWDLPSIKFMKKYNLKYNKIASALLTHGELVTEIAKEKKLTFISTGMSTMTEIQTVVDIFKYYNCPYILLHCNSQYPCTEEKANLKCIRYLGHYFMSDIGYSSHCVGIIDCIAAVVAGANVIEKHITLDRAMFGSDQASSVEINGFKKMVEYIRAVEKCFLGNGKKEVTPEEEIIKKKLRRTKDYVK